MPCYGLSDDIDRLIYSPETYDRCLFENYDKVAVIESKEGCSITHYDYVLCPDGKKKKIFSQEDIDELLSEWDEYIQRNWVNGGKQLFDPENKVKFMLDGIANILLRNHMDGILTEYKKMKIGKYEIPISVCASLFGDELYSERPYIDNGEERTRMEAIMDELSRKYDEVREKKQSKKERERVRSKPPKNFPPTRRQKIEAARRKYGIVAYEFARVDTLNRFFFKGNFYEIPRANVAYAAKTTKDGDVIYDMDQILCGETASGSIVFFDMRDIEPVEGIVVVGEQISFF